MADTTNVSITMMNDDFVTMTAKLYASGNNAVLKLIDEADHNYKEDNNIRQLGWDDVPSLDWEYPGYVDEIDTLKDELEEYCGIMQTLSNNLEIAPTSCSYGDDTEKLNILENNTPLISSHFDYALEPEKVKQIDNPQEYLACAINNAVNTLRENGFSLPEIGKALDTQSKQVMSTLGKEHLASKGR